MTNFKIAHSIQEEPRNDDIVKIYNQSLDLFSNILSVPEAQNADIASNSQVSTIQVTDITREKTPAAAASDWAQRKVSYVMDPIRPENYKNGQLNDMIL